MNEAGEIDNGDGRSPLSPRIYRELDRIHQANEEALTAMLNRDLIGLSKAARKARDAADSLVGVLDGAGERWRYRK